MTDSNAGQDDLDIMALIGEFYDKHAAPAEFPKLGQVVFAPVSFTERRPHMVEAIRSDAHSHTSADIQIRPLDDKVDFAAKDRLPVKALTLGATEELLAVKAKKRPCLVVGVSDGVRPHSLPAGTQRNLGMNSFDRVYALAPFFSASTQQEPTAFGPVIMARIKRMMYPEFLYAPQSGLTIVRPSAIRLDRVFWSPMIACSCAENLFLADEVMGIVSNQLRILAGMKADPEFMEMRELMISDLPADLIDGERK